MNDIVLQLVGELSRGGSVEAARFELLFGIFLKVHELPSAEEAI
jgi:hypothetical protein